MTQIQVLMVLGLLSLAVTAAVYPYVLRYAVRHNVVDNPDARKIHRKPVPVMGGVAVYTGFLAGFVVMWLLVKGASFNWSIMALTFMLLLGVWDDMKNLPVTLRFLAQFSVIGFYIAFTGHYIGSLHGLFGIYDLSPWVGFALSLVGGVGIINAINMIDGIDGYASGFGMMTSSIFACIFVHGAPPVWSCLAVIMAASLLPFFFHNVFGRRSKMFFGDGGSLMLGVMTAIFELNLLSGTHQRILFEEQGVGVVALALAILCIPVFDTLRVMTVRMVRGRSPFKPDKSHLHHLFIDMGFSHLGAAMSILSLNLSVVLAWLMAWACGASIDMQFWIVTMMGMLVTFGFYKLMRAQQHGGLVGEDGQPQGTPMWHKFCRIGDWSHKEKGEAWRVLQNLIDGSSTLRTSAIFDTLNILRAALMGEVLTHDYSDEERVRILKFAHRQAVYGIAFQMLGKKPLNMTRDGWFDFIGYSLFIKKQNAVQNGVLKELAQLLRGHGVQFVVVKGQIAGQNYPEPMARQAGDIDIYCDVDNFALAKRVIEQEWKVEYTHFPFQHHHIQFRYKDVSIEQHHKLIKLYSKKMDRYWDELCHQYYMETDFNGTKVPTLHPTLHTIYLFLHLYHHLSELGIGLRQFCDWAMMLHNHYKDIDYDALRRHLEALGMQRAYRACGTILTDYLGVTEEELGYKLTWRDRHYTKRIIDIVDYRGNMGRYEGSFLVNESAKVHRRKAVFIKLAHFIKLAPLAPSFSVRWMISLFHDKVYR